MWPVGRRRSSLSYSPRYSVSLDPSATDRKSARIGLDPIGVAPSLKRLGERRSIGPQERSVWGSALETDPKERRCGVFS
jgi:hypothetical protein